MTGLRTIWGVEKAHLKQFDEKYSRYFHEQIKSYLNDGDVNEFKDSFVLKPEAKLRADAIAADLFYI